MDNFTIYKTDMEIKISREEVLEQVALTAGYAGQKMTGAEAEGAFERMFTTKADSDQLERFWQECRSDATGALRYKMSAEADDGKDWRVTLTLSKGAEALAQSMGESLQSFFVLGITAKWFLFTNKGEASTYATMASGALDDVVKKAYYKGMPSRPAYLR